MRFWLFFILFMCVITLCISDSSSESNEDSGEQAGGGRGRGNNNPRGGGRGRGTANTNQRGNGNINQQRRGNGNTNQQGRGTGNNNQGRGTSNTNQQGRGTGNTNQQSRGTGNTNQQEESPQIPNGGNRGSTDQQGSSTGGQQNRGKQNTSNQNKNTGSKNKEGKKNGGTKQDTGSQKGKGSDKTGGTNQEGTRNGDGNGKQTTTIKSTQSPSTMVDGAQQGMMGTSNPEGEENKKRVLPCDLTCAPSSNPRRRVCGSDGVTYDTFCQLKAARCLNPDLKFENRGICPTSSVSTSEDSDEDTIQRETVTTRKTPTTVSQKAPTTQPQKEPTTQPQEAPTTLPDVVTTRSPSSEAVTTRRATTVNVEGNITTGLFNNDTATMTPQTSDALDVTTQAPMNMSGNATVPPDGTTIPARSTAMSGTTQPFTVDCPNLCPILRQLVCGTDGTTYQSPCVLQLVACVNNDPTLMVASLGPCPTSTLEPISAL